MHHLSNQIYILQQFLDTKDVIFSNYPICSIIGLHEILFLVPVVYEDFSFEDELLQMIAPLEINNNIEFELDIFAEEIILSKYEEGEQHQNKSEPQQDGKQAKEFKRRRSSRNQRRGRPRLVPLTENVMKARRDAANARERRRMNQMTRAYMTLKQRLPDNDSIISKKQNVDQVLYK